jgi:hypothetical protein
MLDMVIACVSERARIVYPGPLGSPATDLAHAPPTFVAAGALDVCCSDPALTSSSRWCRQEGRQSSTSSMAWVTA